MRDLFDLSERMVYRPLLLGEVAKQIRENPDILFDLKLEEGQKIEWGLFAKNLTPEVVSLFKTWNFKENEKGFEYTFEGIPVQIKLIKRNYQFFARPDTKFYKADDFSLPNPFNTYWKSRFLIQ